MLSCVNCLSPISDQQSGGWHLRPYESSYGMPFSASCHANHGTLIKEKMTKVMMELISNERMKKAQAESSLAKPNTDDDMNIELFLEMPDLIKIPNMDSHRLHMKVFPLLLADDARQWWINEGDGKIITWKEPVEKFFYKFYPLSCDGEDEILQESDN
ncbi:hypothetical protein Tco_1524041 [Tanacetum coccineum]